MTLRAVAGGLTWRTERLEPGFDLLDGYDPASGFTFLHHGRGVAAAGVARTIVVPAGPQQVARAAQRASQALEGFGPGDGSGDGPGPVVVGALPFDGLTPATLWIPRATVHRRGDGSAWRVWVEPSGEAVSRGTDGDRHATIAAHAPGRLDVSAVPEPEAYVAAVTEARRRIVAGELEKVVLARMLVARADHDIDRRALLHRLRDAEPDAYVFAVHGFIGASPELLVARAGSGVTANPLAGTASRAVDAPADERARAALLSSAKDLQEHALVVDAVHDGLAPVCAELTVDDHPSALATSKVWHLSTVLRGTLRAPWPSVLDLAARLHPTPAVCGTPRDAAFAAIGELELIDRTLYAGIVGWMDAGGDGEWAVGLRCAEVQGRIALLFAGAGIVEGSDPAEELAETDAKFRSMLDALGYA